MNLSDLQSLCSSTLDPTEVVMGKLDSDLLLKIFNRLMFNHKVILYQTITALYHDFEWENKGEMQSAVAQVTPELDIIISIPTFNEGNDKLGIATVVPHRESTTTCLSSDDPNIQTIVDEAIHHSAIIHSMESIHYLGLGTKVLNLVLDPHILNKLSPQWDSLPYWGDGNVNPSVMEIEALRAAFKPLLERASADDALALVLH